MLAAGEINATAAEKIFLKMLAGDQSPKAIAEKEHLLAVTDTGAIEGWVDEALAGNPQAVEEVKSGGKKQKKALGYLMGQVMQKSRGAAAPGEVQKLLRAKLGL